MRTQIEQTSNIVKPYLRSPAQIRGSLVSFLIQHEAPVSAHGYCLIAPRVLFARAAAVVLLIAVGRPSAAQQIVVGKNIQVSAARPKASHSEVIMATDPKHADRLIAGVHIAYPDTTMPTTSI